MNPKLRPVEMRWMQQGGQQFLMLRDPLGLSDKSLLVPPALAALLPLCDGTRDLATLRYGLQLRSGLNITPAQVQQIVDQLDGALLLDSPQFAHALAAALEAFRSAPYRAPALAGSGYPAEPDELRSLLDSYAAHAPVAKLAPDGIRGLVSPHIDYHRGGGIYGRAWLAAATALRSAELIIVLGTDHAGGLTSLTPTRQSYATPWGILPTAVEVVDDLVDACGGEDAYRLELNHRGEHSIELALVWLHYVLGERACPVVPVLCGSFEHFVNGHADATQDTRLNAAVEVLADACRRYKTIVVAAADLAHVGPAFGDPAPLGPTERVALAAADRELLDTIATGDAAKFLNLISRDGDARRICGLPPIYLMLRLLPATSGEILAYQQCPADQDGGSWVTISGIVLSAEC